MKSFRFEPLLLTIPFILWFFCFRHFFTGHLALQADAVSYADHIGFYTDNLSRGVFPLWDPAWFNGAPYDFFLRRIGDVNPLLSIIVLLKWFGVPSAAAYLAFLAVYYFLAGWAFYLITRWLLADRFFAFMAYIIFLFSSWGSEIFYNYIIIIFVPIIWFFYFLLCFFRSPQKWSFLGMFLCAGLIVTTYIPFFFLTIMTIFLLLFIVFYSKDVSGLLQQSFSFFLKNKVFAILCIIFLITSCVPALLFYKESKSGEFALPNRHLGANSASAVAVGLDNVASGDIVNHGYFDRIFDDHAHIDMGDIYVPYLFFLLLLSTAFARSNKLIFFLLFNILALSVITITSGAGVHRFLYDHIIFFKFIRNIYYFFWLAMLPMSILLSVTAFRSLLTAITNAPNKMLWFAYILFCHLVFILFLLGHHGVLWGAWAAIFLSLSYFIIYLFCAHRISYPAGFCLFLLAVFIQSAQVDGFLDNKLSKFQQQEARIDQTHQNPKKTALDIYYASSWFSALVQYIDPQVLDDYRKHPFILYDNVIPYKDSTVFFGALQSVMAADTNIAFVSRSESGPVDWRREERSAPQADLEPVSSGELALLPSDANTIKLRAHLYKDQFLVINDNYNTGWHAFINGHQARLLRANFSFKGLWVPSGDSSIVLCYSNPERYIFHFALIFIFMGVFVYLLVLFKRQGPGPYAY